MQRVVRSEEDLLDRAVIRSGEPGVARRMRMQITQPPNARFRFPQVVEEVERYFPGLVFGTRVPRNIRLSEAPSFGTPISQFDPKSKGAAAYAALAEEVLTR